MSFSLAVWDLLSSEEAVGLVASHLAHPLREPIPRREVQSGLLEQNRSSRGLCPGPRPKGEELDGVWVYEDENAATHLIRNAFGASQHVGTAYEMLSINTLTGRWFKDDVTCS
jgi:pyruvate dehydrogenase phosphatase